MSASAGEPRTVAEAATEQPSTVPANFFRSAVSGYVMTAWTGAVSLAVTPVLVHGLGKEKYGIWALATSLALYLELLEFGFGGATVKAVAEARARRDERGLSVAVSSSFFVLALLGLVALVIGGVVAALFPTLFDVPHDLAVTSSIVMGVVAVDLAISVPMDTFGGALLGLQRFDLVNVTLVVTMTAQALSWIVVLALGGGLVPLVIVTVAWSLAGQVGRYFMLRRAVPRLAVSREHVDRRLLRRLSTQSGWFALIDISTLVAVRADTLIVAALIGIPAAAVYAIAQKLVFAVERLVYPVSAGFFGHFSGLAAQNDADALRRSFLVGIRAALFVAAPLAIALGLLAGPIVDAWVGPAYHHAAPVLELLLAYTVVVAFSKPAQLILQGTEHAARAAVVFCGEAVANIVLSVVLGLHWGIVGVAAASLIAGVVFRLGVLVPSACRVAGQTPFSLVVVPTVHLLPAAAAVATALALDHGGLAHGPWVVLATAAVLGVYVVGLSVTGVSGVERRRVLASLRALRHG